MVLTMMTGTLIDGRTVTTKDTVVYPNWGIAFEKLGIIDNGHSVWRHGFAIPFIEIDIPTFAVPDCHSDNALCKTLRLMILDLTRETELTITTIRHHIETVRKLIPVKYRLQHRQKRGWFNFVGSFSKTLFGTATESEIVQLRHVIETIESDGDLVSNQVQRQGRQIHSFMKLTSERISNCMTGITMNRNMVNTLQQKMNQSIATLANNEVRIQGQLVRLSSSIELVATTLRYMTSFQQNIDKLEVEAASWVESVKVLLQGRLPLGLVPPDRLEGVIGDIKGYLEDDYPNFRLSRRNIIDYYEARDLVFSQTDNHIYVSINIPLTATESQFFLYGVHAFPVPVNDSSHNTTIISGHYPFLGISKDGQFYVQLDTSFYFSCKGDLIKHCPQVRSLRHKSVPSCTSALYFDDPDRILEYCDIDYKTNGLFEGVYDLGDSYFLASSADATWGLSCHGDQGTRIIKACVLCIIQVPCSCRLTSSKFELPPRLSGCKSHDKTTYLYPVSLTVLHSLFPKSVVERISGLTASNRTHSIVVPNFDIKADNWTDIMHKDKKLTFDFKAIAKAVKKGNDIFATKADYLSNRILRGGHLTSPSLWYGFDLPTGIMSLVALTISCYTFYKLRSLTALLVTAAAIPKANANIIVTNVSHAFDFHKVMEEMNPLVESLKETLDFESIALRIMLSGAIVIILYCTIGLIRAGIFFIRNYCSDGCRIVLGLASDQDTVMIDLLTIPGRISKQSLSISCPPMWRQIKLMGSCLDLCSFILIDWDCCVQSPEFGNPNPLPQQIHLSRNQARMAKIILDTNYEAKLFILHKGCFLPLPVETPPSAPAVDDVSVNGSMINLYPILGEKKV